MSRQAIALLVLILSGLTIDQHALAQGASGLPDPMSSSTLTDLLIHHGDGDLPAHPEELIAGPIDRYMASFRALRNGPIEGWLDTRRENSTGFFADPEVDAVRDEARERNRLVGRIAELDDMLFAELMAGGVSREVVEAIALARSRDRSLSIMGRPWSLRVGVEPMAVYETTVGDLADESPSPELDVRVRNAIEEHQRARTPRLDRLARSVIDLPIARGRLMEGVQAPFGLPEELTAPGQLEEWFTARREAAEQAKVESLRIQDAIRAEDEQAMQRLVEMMGEETSLAQAFARNWKSSMDRGRKALDLGELLSSGSVADLPDFEPIPVDFGGSVQITGGVDITGSVDAIEAITLDEMPEGVGGIIQITTTGDGEEVLELLDSMMLDDGQAMVGMSMGASTIGIAPGLPRPLDRRGFEAICERLDPEDLSRSIADVLFMEYREAWTGIQESLVEEWRELPRFTFGPEGPTFPDAQELDRAMSLRHSILDELRRIDRGLLSDLDAVLHEGPALQQELLRRRRETSLDVSRANQSIGMPVPPAGFGVIDLQLVANGVVDPIQRAIIDPALDEWATTITPMIEKQARRSITLDRDDQRIEREMIEIFAPVVQEDPGSTIQPSLEQNEIFGRAQDNMQERLAMSRSLEKAGEGWIDRIGGMLDEDSAAAFRLECERTAWPRCFRDPRSPAENFDRALSIQDLDATTRLAIETLQTEWSEAWILACRSLVELERSNPTFEAMVADEGSFDTGRMLKNRADRKRIRFERNELDERAMRDLKALLSPEHQEIVGDLPEKAPRGRGSGLPFDLEDIEFLPQN